MTFGEKLKALRIENNISQKELANNIDISQQSIALYENNKRNPSYKILGKICRFFKVSLEYFFDEPELSKSNLYRLIGATYSFADEIMYCDNIDENIFFNELQSYLITLNDYLLEIDNSKIISLRKRLKLEQTDIELLCNYFSKLNDLGQKEALIRLQELSELEKYTESTI